MAITGLKKSFLLALAGALIFGLAGVTFAVERNKSADQGLAGRLAQVKLFAGLTDSERKTLEAAALLRHAAPGERIIQQGKPLESMFIVLNGEGEVRIKGKRIVALSGQFLVGEMEFLDGLPAGADVVLLKGADVIVINNAKLAGLFEKNPRIGYVLMREMAQIEARRLRDTNPK